MTFALVVGVTLAAVVVIGVLTALLSDSLAAVVVFSAYSFAMAVLWILLQAPDVALTEAAVGAGVVTSLFLVAIRQTVGWPETVSGSFVSTPSPRGVLVAGAAAATLGLTVPAFPAFGSADAPPFQRVAPYYLANAKPDLGIVNVVTAILAVYRGFDTFVEVAVVFTAGVAVLVVFGREVGA